MLKTRHFHSAVIFLILINTHLSEASLCDYYDDNCGWGIAIIILAIIATLVFFLSCYWFHCINESFVTTDDFNIETPIQNEPPLYLRNESVTMNQAQNQATYDYETLPQPLPKFGLPERPTIQDNQHIGMTLSPNTSPSAPQAYSENSNKTCQCHANCQNSPQPLPRFHGPQTISSPTNQYNAHNDITLSPTSTLSSSTPFPSWAPPPYSENSNASCQILPQSLQTRDQYNEQNGTISTLSPTSMLSSTLPLDSDPPPYSEISNGEWINGTWVHHYNSETLPQPLPGASERFSDPESEATCNTQNETTTSPKPILYSYTS